MKIFITGHTCGQNAIVDDRYWLVNIDNQIFKHLGVGNLDRAFLRTILGEFNVELVQMHIPDDAFKNLLISLGYKQS